MLGLRARILLSLAVVTLGGVASVGVIAIWQAKQVLASDRVERAQRLGEATARLSEAALDPTRSPSDPENRRRIAHVADAVARAETAREVVFFDDSGQMIAGSGPPLESDGRGVRGAVAGVPPHAEERPAAPGDPKGLLLVVYGRVGEGSHPLVARTTYAVEATLDSMLDRARTTVMWLGAIDALLLLVGAAWLLRGAVVRPVLALERAARRVADGDLEARVEVRGPGELEHLADAFDRMTQSLREGRESLIRSEKLASVGRLAAGVAHEVGNPLAAILGYVEMLLDDQPAKPLAPELERDILTRVRNETQRIHHIIQELLEYARPGEDSVEAVDVARVIEGALSLVKAQAKLRQVKAEVDVPERLPPARAGAGRLTQVLLNLLLNAADATDGKGRLRVTARAAEKHLTIAVEDDGPGVPAAERAKIFDPFYTTKAPGEGTGLGLSVSLAIVEGYGGTLRLADTSGLGGARFEVALPTA